MTWFKVDDQAWSHPKFTGISDGATALWLRAGSYSAAYLTDGFIPEATARRTLGGTTKTIRELLQISPGAESPLWHEVEGGYLFHDWDDYQERSEDVKRRREEARVRMQNVRANKQGSSHNPVPSRPDRKPRPKTDQSSSTSRPREAVEDRSSYAQGGDRPVEGMRPNAEKIQQRIQEITGREVDAMTAHDLAEHYLARATRPPRQATRYVITCLSGEDLPVLVEYLETGRWTA